MHFDQDDLGAWTKEGIDRECKAVYRAYEGAVIDRYVRYFASNPHLRCPNQRYSARSLVAALPPGYGELRHLIEPHHLHNHARSGRSSQILALSLLGAAMHCDPSMRSFWTAIGVPELCATDDLTALKFEHALDPTSLNEQPRVTKIDLSISNRRAFAAVEFKWSENGFPSCSCLRDGDGCPAPGYDCAARVRAREAYWQTAAECFSLDRVRIPRNHCSVSTLYQPIRSLAAARNLAGGRTSVAVVVFDQHNPYFAATGDWAGWPALLRRALQRSKSEVVFKTISWQSLLPQLAVPESVRIWAMEKHRLPVHSITANR